MKSVDPLERAFEFIKADSTGLAFNPNLETRLMTEFQKQKRPSRWKRAAWVVAALVAFTLAGGGLAAAAGYNPLGQFIFMDADGNSIEFQAQNVVQNEDGSVTMTGTVAGAEGKQQTVAVEWLPLEPKK